jgi:hypothetical protein
MFNTVSSIKEPTISSNKFTREEIIRKNQSTCASRIQVSIRIDILFKHREALSISKTDLGRAKKLLYHRIHLKDKHPIYRKAIQNPRCTL